MSGHDPNFFSRTVPGLKRFWRCCAFLAASLLLGTSPAHAVRRRHHHSTLSTTPAAHPTSLHPTEVRRGHTGASRRTHRQTARQRAAALDVVRSTAKREIAPLPLKSYGMLPALKGSRESLLRQNERADQEGLSRITDDTMLAEMAESGALVPVPTSSAITVDPRLEPERRYCRPWTARFLTDLARYYYAQFHSALRVDSAVRTIEYQEHLLLVNGNAAPAEGDTSSPHLTGEAVDLGKKGLSRAQIEWLRAYLLPLQSAGTLDVEEEFKQACFHISVYESYSPSDPVAPTVPAKRTVRSRHHHAGALLATRLP